MAEVADAAPITTWAVERPAELAALTVSAMPGHTSVIVGANGSGKSALVSWMAANAGGHDVVKVAAHRRIWLAQSAPTINPGERQSFRTNTKTWDADLASRYMDHGDNQRAIADLYDLIDLEHEFNRQIVEQVQTGKTFDEAAATVEPNPLDRVNRVLTTARVGLTVRVSAESQVEAVREGTGATYPIAQMSDGEKSALLLSIRVIAAPKAAIIILDEPERHLHRSISRAVISTVIAERPDCHVVVATHDLDLASGLAGHTTSVYVATSAAGRTPNRSGGPSRKSRFPRSFPKALASQCSGAETRPCSSRATRGASTSSCTSCFTPAGWSCLPAAGRRSCGP